MRKSSAGNRLTVVAQALLQLTAKLAQQAISLSSVRMLWLTAHCFASQTGYYKRKLACFCRQHCPLEGLLAYGFCLLLCRKIALLLTTVFLGQRTVRLQALQLALRTMSAALVPPTHAFDGLLGLPGRTASQIELSSHTNCSAKQGLVLVADF